MPVVTRQTVVALTMFLLGASPMRSIAQSLLSETAHPVTPSSRKITIDVVVDAKGAKLPSTVAGLQQQDFTVLDNKTPRALDSFRAISAGQQPVRVVLLVDAVNIGTDRLGDERNQILAFLRGQGQHLAHPTTVAILSDRDMKLQAGFSTDGDEIAAEFEKQVIAIRSIGRDTGLWGAVDRSEICLNALRVLATREGQQPGRTVVLWISPGWPLLSGAEVELNVKDENRTFDEIVSLSTQLREARVTLYAIDPLGSGEDVGRARRYEGYLKGVSKPSQVEYADLGLQVVAAQSGGLAVTSNDIASLLQRCVAELDNYYEISFEAPAETRDTYHRLEIKLDKPGMVARTRDGYYAQP